MAFVGDGMVENLGSDIIESRIFVHPGELAKVIL